MGSARFELATYGLRDAAPGLGMGLDLIPLSIKSSTYENSTELDRKCPKPAASAIAIKCAIKWRPADPVILSLAKAVSGAEIGRCRASGTRKKTVGTDPDGIRMVGLPPSVSWALCPRKRLSKGCVQAVIPLLGYLCEVKFIDIYALCQKLPPQSLRVVHRLLPSN